MDNKHPLPKARGKQKIVSYLFSKVPPPLLRKWTGGNLIIPYYHMVSDREVLHIKHLFRHKTIGQFKDDLEFLLKYYSPVGLVDVMDRVRNNRSLPENAFLLTFDDGYREMHDIVAPILVEKGIPATFFLNSAFIDNRELCFLHKASLLMGRVEKTTSLNGKRKIEEILKENGIPCSEIMEGIVSITYQQRDILDPIGHLMDVDFNDYLLKREPYLTTYQIERLIRDGFTIGAHSVDHPLYASLSLKDQLDQTMKSVAFIRERFRLKYGVFAFPHSDRGITGTFFEELHQSGLVELTFGTRGMIKDCVPNHLQRFSLEKPLLPAKRIIALQSGRKLFRITKGSSQTTRRRDEPVPFEQGAGGISEEASPDPMKPR